MYKMVIVDDEEYVREGLKDTIDWLALDINIVGEAGNGKSALEIIKLEKPEIVLTDISMPYLDGLELIQKTLELVPHTKVILISGYEDFKYAQEAIRNKAFDYILKPIVIENIIEVINNAKDQIESELNRLENERELKRQIEESLPVLRERYLGYILTGALLFEEIEEKHKYLDIKIEDRNIVVMVIKLEELPQHLVNKKQLFILGLKKELRKIVKKYFKSEVLDEWSNRIIIINNYNPDYSRVEVIDMLQNLGDDIYEHIIDNYDCKTIIGVGKLYDSAEHISDSYQEAMEAAEYKIFIENENTIFYNDVSVSNESYKAIYPMKLENKVITAIKIGDIANVSKYIDDFIYYFLKKEQVTPEELRNSCVQLVYFILRKITEWNNFINYSLNNIKIQEQINNISSCKELGKWLINFVEDITKKVHEEKVNKRQNDIQKACNYIENNYQKDLTLKEIASSIYLTQYYFANLFKEETGKTAMTYLTEIRMEKAKELLLETNDKICEIAKRVGYNNASYFGQSFKKETGLSPNNFRKKN